MVNTITNHTTIQTDINTILNKDTKKQASTIDLNLKDLKDLNIPSIIPQDTEQSKKNLHNNAINQLTKVYNPQPTQIKEINIESFSDDLLEDEFDQYIIQDLFKKDTIHMICAPVQVPLLSIFLRLIADWSEGRSFLGYKCNPTPFRYIDNLNDRKSLTSILRDLDIQPSLFKGLPKTHASTIENTLKQIEDNTTVFINHLATSFSGDLTHGEAINSPSKVTKLISSIKDICRQKHLTIITTHLLQQDPKRPPLERVFGSTMWVVNSDTTITIDPNLKIPYNYFINTFSQTSHNLPYYGTEYKFEKPYGILIPATTTNLDLFLNDLTINQPYTVKEIEAITSLQKSRVYTKLKQAIKNNQVKKTGSTYVRIK